MIVISNSLVLAPATVYLPNNPVIGWHNLVTPDNVTADTEAAGYPISNVANPITAPLVRWQAADATAQAITVDLTYDDEIDYIAIARHNLGSEQIPVTVEGSSNLGVDYDELVQEVLLPDDAPALFQFTPQGLTNIRLSLGASPGDPAYIAVVYVGKLLTLQRRIYVGHVPIKYGRSSNVVNGRSEGGDFLGRIVLSETTATAVDLANITAGWYRATLDPFIKTGRDTPFFFAWRPETYPYEVGYCWITNDPQPQNQRPNGMMQIQLQMTGIAP